MSAEENIWDQDREDRAGSKKERESKERYTLKEAARVHQALGKLPGNQKDDSS